jgi:hypothetical protein
MQFQKLSQQEAFLLWMRCHDYSLGEMKEKLVVEDSGYYRIQRSAFDNLGIKAKGQSAWRIFVQNKGCETIKNLSKEEIRDWDLTKKSLIFFEAAPDEEPEPVPESDTESKPDADVDSPHPSGDIFSNVQFMLILAFVVLLIIAALFGPEIRGILGLRRTPTAVAEAPQDTPKTPSDTPPSSIMPSATLAPVVPPANTPIPTDIPEPTALPTTPPPEIVIAPPTDTPLPSTPTPKITLPFTDNFEGEDFVWEPVRGNWFIANRKLTVDKDDVGMSWIGLDEPSLEDYRVTVDIEVPIIGTANEGDFAVGVRWIRGQSKILAYAKHRLLSESGWAIFTADSVNGDPVVGYDVRVSDHFQLVLEVKGNSYKALIDGFEAQSIIYPGFEKGGIILGIRCVTDCPTFDNFKLEPLN